MSSPGRAERSGPGACHLDVDAVLFDLDGVLVDSTGSVERIWRAFALEHGLDADELLDDLHGRRMVDIVAAALPHLGPDALADEARRVDAAEAADAHDALALPGALDLTRDLTRRGVPWAVATSGTVAVATARLAAVGLAAPAVLVTAGDVDRGKPAPDPYLAAARRLGVAPTRCLVVEDAPSGLRAGNAAGATTVAVTTSHTPEQLGAADHRVSTAAQVQVEADGSRVGIRMACLAHRLDR